MKDNITIIDFGMVKVTRLKLWLKDSTLSVRCAWCKRELKPPMIPAWLINPVVSHGICPDCSRGILDDL